MRPHLMLTADATAGLRCVDDVRESITDGQAAEIWRSIESAADAWLDVDPLLPSTELPGRPSEHAAAGNRDYHIVNGVCERLLHHAFVGLIRQDDRQIKPMLAQLDALFNHAEWADWRDLAHMSSVVDLRHGQFARGIGLMYDWVYSQLEPSDRSWIVENYDRRGVQPYFESIKAGDSCTNNDQDKFSNWNTVIVGGYGFAGMGLAGDHPQSDVLVDRGNQLMDKYVAMYGSDGEFNESPGYAGATGQPVTYLHALRYHTAGEVNRLGDFPWPQTCYWMAHQVQTDGSIAAYGDTWPERPAQLYFHAAVADATQDSFLQYVYEQRVRRHGPQAPIMELLWHNPALSGRLADAQKPPCGKAYQAHSMLVSSRLDWDLEHCPMIVSGKGGHGREGHGQHDAGQVLITGFGKQLIVDTGALHYPADYFHHPQRYAYYNGGAVGHNILTFDREELRSEKSDKAAFQGHGFEDGKGGWWRLDLTPMYDHAKVVRRSVIHLGLIAAVLDDVVLDEPKEASLRWHTCDRAEPDAEGRFTVAHDGVRMACQVIRADGGERLNFSRGEHCYKSPYDRNRLGNLLEQKHESYVEATVTDQTVRLLSLFRPFPPGSAPNAWRFDEGIWTSAGNVMDPRRYGVRVDGDLFAAFDCETEEAWEVEVSV